MAEIKISDYFKNVYDNRYKASDWRWMNSVRDDINSLEWEDDIYEYIFQHRRSAFNRMEDERLFGIPKTDTVDPGLHAHVKNRYYHYDAMGRRFTDEELQRRQESLRQRGFGAGAAAAAGMAARGARGKNGEPLDYWKRDKNGKLKFGKDGLPLKMNRFQRGAVNAMDNLKSSKMSAFVRFAVSNPYATLVMLSAPFAIAALLSLVIFVVGTVNSIGHTPFVLCTEDDTHTQNTWSSIISDDELESIATSEYASRVFIYMAQHAGYQENAIIGALSYMLQEGMGMGTFTYEAYYCVTGPGGQISDKTLDNQAWLEWLDGPGREQLHDKYYHNKAASGTGCFENDGGRYSAVGLGLLQDSDVWNYHIVCDDDGNCWEEPYKVTSNATRMIEWCEERGKAWQDPITQVEWVLYRFSTSAAWDGDGADPTKDNRPAEEWCRRVTAGIGMPAWDWTDDNKYMDDHTQHLAEAKQLYEKWSGQELDVYNLTSNLKDLCEGVKTMYMGGNQSIAAACVSLASGDRTMGDSKVPFDMHGPDSPNLNDPSNNLLTYKKVHETIFPGDKYFASCDRSVATAIRWCGADDQFPAGATSTQMSYLERSDRWDYVGVYGQCTLMPGDVLITDGHIKCYVGTEAANERFPGSEANMYQGSLEDYFPILSKDDPSYDTRVYQVYRCTNPQNSDRYVNAASGEINED